MQKSEKEKFIKMSLDEVISEHKRLTNVLRKPTKAKLKSELRIQTDELNKYLGE